MSRELIEKRTQENVGRFRSVVRSLEELYEDKNRRYGDSFGTQMREDGLQTVVFRLGDKFNRFKTLVTHPEDDMGDESIDDTLADMANYAIMTLMELRSPKKFKKYKIPVEWQVWGFIDVEAEDVSAALEMVREDKDANGDAFVLPGDPEFIDGSLQVTQGYSPAEIEELYNR